MRDRRAERRALFESILGDPGASHAERLRADEALLELERSERDLAAVERLSPEQVRDELASLAAAVPGMLAVAAGPDAVVAPDQHDADELLALALEVNDRLEARLAERERALQRLTVQRLLPPAPRRVVG